MLSKTHAEKVPHVTLIGIHKKQSFVRSSETLEQQQDFLSTVPKQSNSNRIHAKQNARRKSASRDLWNP